MTTSFATSEKFWPLTFGERGVLVPFTTPLLAASRIRGPDLKRAEILIPGLSGGKGTYVIPWRSVLEMFKLTVHDRALHEAISESETFGPAQVRQAALRVAKTGLAGISAGGAARGYMKREDNIEVVAQFFLTLRVIERLAAKREPLSLSELSTAAGQQKAGRLLTGIAGSLGVSFEVLQRRLQSWAKAVARVGLAEMPSEAPVRRLVIRLSPLADSFLEWGKSDMDGDGPADAQLASDIARETWRLAKTCAAEIDRTAEQPGETLWTFDSALEGLGRSVDKLLWILDGWEQVIKLWDLAANRPREEQRAVLRDIVRHLPVVPRDEIPASNQEVWAGLVSSLRKQIRPVAGEGSATIGIDFDHMLRLEKLKGAQL